MKTKLWFDDYFAIVALFFITSYCSVIVYWTHSFKLGLSLSTISDPAEAIHIQDRSRLLLWICELLYASSIAVCKLSILCFYWRVFQHTSIRYAIIGLLVAVSIWITIRTFMVIFHCVPVQAYWNKDLQGAKCPFNEANFFFATILVHTTMDCIILILPVIEVMKMTLPLSQKLAVVGLFTSGTIVCIASIFVLVHSKLYNPRTDDIPKDMAANMMWSTVETNMAVFSGMKESFFTIVSRADRKYSLSAHASAHFPPLPSWTLNDRRISSGADKSIKRRTTSNSKDSVPIKETGVSKVGSFWFI